MPALPALLALAAALSATALSAADPSTSAAATDPAVAFDPYTVVEAAIGTHVTDKGQGDIIMRYVLKSATMEKIGGRWFIVGRTPAADHVTVAGSDWHTLMIPMDSVRVMAGAIEPADFVQDRTNANREPIGFPIDPPAADAP